MLKKIKNYFKDCCLLLRHFLIESLFFIYLLFSTIWITWHKHAHVGMHRNDFISNFIFNLKDKIVIPISEYISNRIGHEFHSEWLFDLFFFIGGFIFFVWLVFEEDFIVSMLKKFSNLKYSDSLKKKKSKKNN